MNRIEKIGYDPQNKRDLYFLELDESIGKIDRFDLSSPHFYCFIAWDSLNATVDDISQLVESLIRSGASYFCTWGPGCERVHDIIDERTSYPYDDLNIPEDSIIMTSWHSHESLHEALYFFLNSTHTVEHYLTTSNCSLAISISSKIWSEEILNVLEKPREFSERFEYE